MTVSIANSCQCYSLQTGHGSLQLLVIEVYYKYWILGEVSQTGLNVLISLILLSFGRMANDCSISWIIYSLHFLKDQNSGIHGRDWGRQRCCNIYEFFILLPDSEVKGSAHVQWLLLQGSLSHNNFHFGLQNNSATGILTSQKTELFLVVLCQGKQSPNSTSLKLPRVSHPSWTPHIVYA